MPLFMNGCRILWPNAVPQAHAGTDFSTRTGKTIVLDGRDQSSDEVTVTAVELGIYDMCKDMWGWDAQVIAEGAERLSYAGFNAALVPMAGGDT